VSDVTAFDALLALLVVGLGGAAVLARDAFTALAGFAALGLVLVLAWLRLAAPDVAMTEGAVGSGLAGFLLFGALARERARGAAEPDPPVSWRLCVASLTGVTGATLAWLLVRASEPGPTLAPLAQAPLAALDMGNPVAATLMAYRALDTFLEVVVLLLAWVGVASLADDRAWSDAPRLATATPDPALRFAARTLPPFGVVFALYLGWNGSTLVGGEFPAAAVLAAMGLLVLSAGLARLPRAGDGRLRLALVAGPAVFLLVGLAGMALAGAFLGYPDGFAKPLVLAIEGPLIGSLAALLILLVAGAPTTDRATCGRHGGEVS
jgi:uncharacterized MnhB-related membrane protein